MALALTVIGSASAQERRDDSKHYKPNYPFCPAKSKDKCEDKGGKYYHGKCTIVTDRDVEYCDGGYVAKKIEYTVWSKDDYKCKKEKYVDEKCFKKDYGKLIPVDFWKCEKACEDEHRGGHHDK